MNIYYVTIRKQSQSFLSHNKNYIYYVLTAVLATGAMRETVDTNILN